MPLNSPEPLESIRLIADRYGQEAIVGAGTVLTAKDVDAVKRAGGRIIVSPNMNPAVGQAAVEHGLAWCPGVLTPSEAFAALEIGASVLKFFPAEMVPPSAIGAMRAVLPKSAIVAAVGGVNPEKMASYWNAGANGFGLGSALFKPDYPVDEVAARALSFVEALTNLRDVV